MTEIEQLKKVAEFMGLRPEFDNPIVMSGVTTYFIPSAENRNAGNTWNPAILLDDAMRVAMWFQMSVRFHDCEDNAPCITVEIPGCVEPATYGIFPDSGKVVCQAILHCAAKMASLAE